MVGLVGGCFNFIGGLSAVIVPIAIGYLAQDGDFKPALMLIAALGMCGLCSYLFLVGKVEQITVPSDMELDSAAELVEASIIEAKSK